MSTKTTFKRIALVAVAALGLGVLSVAPSSAAPTGTTIAVVQNGANSIIGVTTGVSSDSTTSAIFTVTSLMTALSDSVSVTFVKKAEPTDSTVNARMTFLDTATTTSTAKVNTNTALAAISTSSLSQNVITDSVTAGSYLWMAAGTANSYASANFTIGLDSATAVAKAGTYTYTVVATSYTAGVASATVATADVSIVVSASTDQSKTPSGVKAFANLVASAKTAGTAKESSDAVQSILATAGTAAGYIFVGNRNSVDGATTAEDSLTAVVTGAGVVCTNTGTAASPVVGACGKSLSKIKVTGDYEFILQADGTSGTSSVAITSGVLGTTYTKSLNFYASTPKTITASVFIPRLVVGSNDSAVVVTAVDANGINYTGTLYIYPVAAADALVSGAITTGIACVASSDKTKQYCPLTTKTAGTANFKVGNKSDTTLVTVSSDAISVTASTAAAATVKLAFDKATYAPGEKAVITVTPVDSSGNLIPAVSSAALLSSTSAAITSNVALTVGSSQTATVQADGTTLSTSAYAGTDKTAGSYSIVVYMPLSSVTVTISAKGGTALPLAGQVAVTASATVVNASVDAATDAANEATDAANAATDAALAAADAADAATAAAQDASDAVAALSASVEKLVASLKAQLTSLTNLVIKIQKKVKA